MTAQIHERLILDGQETSMAFCPPLPEGHPRIIEVDPDDAEHCEADPILFSTACWREYLGTWEIRDAAVRGADGIPPGLRCPGDNGRS